MALGDNGIVSEEEFLPSVRRMSRDVRQAAETLSETEARFLVDSYYTMQGNRMKEAQRVRQMRAAAADAAPVEEEDDDANPPAPEPDSVLSWLALQNRTLENQVKGALGRFAAAHPVGQWSLSQVGIGPVISAGLLAYLDPLYPTVGHIYSFCGLNPTVTWKKGEKRPWSRSAKQIAFKIGDSMVKQSGREGCLYGAIYRARKEVEVRRNLAGRYADQAAATLAQRKITDAATRKVYEAGRLPDGRIDLRARRIAVNLFLSHWHTVAHFHATGKLPPAPYAIAHLGHAHYIAPPNFDPKTFPVRDPVQEAHAVSLSAAVAKYAGRSVTEITSIDDAVSIIRSVE